MNMKWEVQACTTVVAIVAGVTGWRLGIHLAVVIAVEEEGRAVEEDDDEEGGGTGWGQPQPRRNFFDSLLSVI